MGETLETDQPQTAEVTLQAPEWMELGELALYVDGIEVALSTTAVRPQPPQRCGVHPMWSPIRCGCKHLEGHLRPGQLRLADVTLR